MAGRPYVVGSYATDAYSAAPFSVSPSRRGQYGNNDSVGYSGYGGYGGHAGYAYNDAYAGYAGSGNFDDDPMPVQRNRNMPSTKVQFLANEIEELESKCSQLEGRNNWLTKRLLSRQRRFIEKTLLSNSKIRLRRSFEAWRESMHEMRLERHLDEQTASLDQCQQVAKELGAALAQEQEARKASEESHMSMRGDLERAMQQEKRLKHQHKEQQLQLELLERRVQEAESCLMRSRADAQAVIESADLYEKKRRDMEYEVQDDRRRYNANPMEHSVRLRDEANGVMKKVTSLLHNRPASPEREP